MSEAYRLAPPCSIVPKWKPAVSAIACGCLCGVRSSSLRGIAGCLPTARSGTACGRVSPRSGFFESLRYRVHQLVSMVSSVRLVKRPI